MDRNRLESLLKDEVSIKHDSDWYLQTIQHLISIDDETLVETFRACLSVLSSRLVEKNGDPRLMSEELFLHGVRKVLYLIEESLNGSIAD